MTCSTDGSTYRVWGLGGTPFGRLLTIPEQRQTYSVRMTDFDDEWEIRAVHIPKGTKLSNSRKNSDLNSDLLRDVETNEVRGPAESKPVDFEEVREGIRQEVREELRSELEDEGDDDDDYYVYDYEPAPPRERSPKEQEMHDLAVQMATEAGVFVIENLIKPFVKQKIIPAAKARFAQTKAKQAGINPEAIVIEPVDTVQDVEVTRVAASRNTMSASEFRELFQQLVAAEAKRQALAEALANADIDDDAVTPEIAAAMRLAIDGRISEVAPDALAAFVAYLGMTVRPDGSLVLEDGVQPELLPTQKRPRRKRKKVERQPG